jgi:nucleoside-diphosphate-sugar epimerase
MDDLPCILAKDSANERSVKIFLTGASGFVGSHLAQSLIAAGHEVVAHYRSPQLLNSKSEHNLQVWSGDLNDVQSLAKRLQGIDSVIHCAAEMKLWNSKKALHETNVLMTQHILKAAKQAGVAQCIYMSDASVAKAPSIPNLEVCESRALPSLEKFPYSHSKSLAEEYVLAAGDESFRVISLRPASIWGKGDLIDRILSKAANLNQFGWFNQGDYLFSTCYIQNLCEAVNKALLSKSNRESFFISDGPPILFRQWMSRRLLAGHYKVPTLSIPRFLAWPLARFTENGWNYLPLRGDPPLIREMVHLMAHPFSVSITKAQEQLAYQPLYGMEEGMLELEKSSI